MVDDDPIVLESCKRILESAEYLVVCVPSAGEAFENLERGHFDLMIMDIKMPDRTASISWKDQREMAPGPVSGVSRARHDGISYPGDPERAEEKRRRHFIPKPFTPDELLAAVQKILERSEPMKRIKALVIDDEEIVLDSVKKILSQENFNVDIALSSRKGLRLALNNPYDIVLTDIRMPEIGGMSDLAGCEEGEAIGAGGDHHGLCHGAVLSAGDEARRDRLHRKALYPRRARQEGDGGD